MTTVSLEYSDDWVMADLTADPQEWTRATIRERAGEEEVDLPDEQVDLLAEFMLPALESARTEEFTPLMVLFLLPEADAPVLCSVTLRAEAVEPEVSLTDLLEALRLPDEMLEQPAEQELLQTRSGEAAHLIQRYRAPVNPEYELVQEHEAFVWRLEGAQGTLGIYLSTSHLDLVRAATLRPKLIEMASSLALVPDQA